MRNLPFEHYHFIFTKMYQNNDEFRTVLQLPVKYPQLPAFLISKIEILIRCISHLSFLFVLVYPFGWFSSFYIRRENNALNSLGVILEQLLSECVFLHFTTVIWF